MSRAVVLFLIAAVLSACGGGAPASPPAPASLGSAPAVPPASEPVSATPSASADGSASKALVPAADAAIPSRPGPLAEALARATRVVRGSVTAWVREGGASRWPPPGDLVRWALYEQRAYRVLGRRPALAAAVLERLPRSIRREAALIVRATADIFAQANPVPPSYAIRTRNPEPPEALLAYFRQAERRFGVDWHLLAAVAYVESKFGRVVSDSTAGAQGPMQFLPSTWEAYGMGGDVHDPHDAILGAANYLHASGSPGDDRRALYAYNPVPEYVDAVIHYADAIRRDVRVYYAMYCWQVFVLTTEGDRRVTGPGL